MGVCNATDTPAIPCDSSQDIKILHMQFLLTLDSSTLLFYIIQSCCIFSGILSWHSDRAPAQET